MSGIITLPAETLAIVFARRRGRKTERIEAQHLQLGAASGAGEDLAPIHVEVGDPDRMLTGGARRLHGVWQAQLKSIFTTRVVVVPPHSTRAEKVVTQNERSIPESVFPEMSRLRG